MKQTRGSHDGLPLPHEGDEDKKDDDEVFQWFEIRRELADFF